MRYIEEDDVWVPRIFFTSDRKQTLGSNFLQGKNVLFDLDRERMGFAESDCREPSVESLDSDLLAGNSNLFRESVVEQVEVAAMEWRQSTHQLLATGVIFSALFIVASARYLYRRTHVRHVGEYSVDEKTRLLVRQGAPRIDR